MGTSTRRSTIGTAERPDAAARACSQARSWHVAEHHIGIGPRDRGSITPGKRADLILIDGDPTTNIADIRKVALVITQGKLLSPPDVDQALGIKPFVQNVPTMRDVAPVSAGY